MRVFKNAWFVRFARKERISDAALCDAVARAEKGLIDADLGGGLLKQRVARSGGGKSGGYRALLFSGQARAPFSRSGSPRVIAPILMRTTSAISKEQPS